MEPVDLEQILESHGVYSDLERWQNAKGAGDDEIVHAPNIIKDLRKWVTWLFYINDGEAKNENG